MSEFAVRGQFNLPLFSEEVVAVFPELVQGNEPSLALFTLSYDDGTMHFKSITRIDEKQFLGLVQAHNPNAKSRNERRRDRFQQLSASIRQKLLGLGFTPEEIGFLQEFLAREGPAGQAAATGRPV